MSVENAPESQAVLERAVTMEKMVNLCKRRGLVFPTGDIYGGLGSTFDYGPLGVELKRNVKEAWWREMVQRRSDDTVHFKLLDQASAEQFIAGLRDLCEAVRAFPAPVIARIPGWCLGGGL